MKNSLFSNIMDLFVSKKRNDNKLLKAAINGNLKAVRAALAEGADVNVKETTTSATALWMASMEGHIEVVKLLLERGKIKQGQVELRDKYKGNPLEGSEMKKEK